MPGSRPGMTAFDKTRYFIGCILSQTPSMRSGEVQADRFQFQIEFHVRRIAKVGVRWLANGNGPRVRKLTPSHPDIDAISSYYRTMATVDVLQWRELPAGEFR